MCSRQYILYTKLYEFGLKRLNLQLDLTTQENENTELYFYLLIRPQNVGKNGSETPCILIPETWKFFTSFAQKNYPKFNKTVQTFT
jgi:hypothetical protein